MVDVVQVANLPGTAPILSCAATIDDGAPLLFTGSEDGILTTWDLRHTRCGAHPTADHLGWGCILTLGRLGRQRAAAAAVAQCVANPQHRGVA